jgi:hypothetical protein
MPGGGRITRQDRSQVDELPPPAEPAPLNPPAAAEIDGDELAPWLEPLTALAGEIGSTVAVRVDRLRRRRLLPAQDEGDRRRGPRRGRAQHHPRQPTDGCDRITRPVWLGRSRSRGAGTLARSAESRREVDGSADDRVSSEAAVSEPRSQTPASQKEQCWGRPGSPLHRRREQHHGCRGEERAHGATLSQRAGAIDPGPS